MEILGDAGLAINGFVLCWTRRVNGVSPNAKRSLRGAFSSALDCRVVNFREVGVQLTGEPVSYSFVVTLKGLGLILLGKWLVVGCLAEHL